MKFALLCRNPKLYSHRRLITAAESRGHEIRPIDPLACSMNITTNRPAIRYRHGEILKDFDAVIPRIGASITFFGTAVLRQFEVMGVLSLNDSLAIARARDKLRALQLLSRSQIPMPTTVFARNPDDTDDVIRLVGGAPLVVKLLEGTQGVGVVLAETKKAAESVIQAFEGLDVSILVQEFIKEAGGNDIRCLVIGNKVVAAMERHAAEGEFRANLHRGGTATLTRITPEERKLAVRAVKILGLNVAGVDLLRAERGSLLLEVNASPGLEGIERASNKDIAGMIIAFLESKLTEGRKSGEG